LTANSQNLEGVLLMKMVVVPVTPFQQNCSLLWDEADKLCTVVDPGGEVARILAEASRLDLTITQIVITHGHIDHAGGADELRESLSIPIIGPDRRDLFLLENLAAQGRRFGINDARNVVPDRWLSEGDTIGIAGSEFAVLHCPGHSPGSVVLFSAADKFALVGDVLFRGSVGRTDFPYGDSNALIEAIKTKLLPLGDDVSFLCGHGPGSTIGRERKANPFIQPGNT
jgi:glyoxylase-like metal-dependent hydrolase (beta-lactamase superfamily II)